MGSVGGLLHLDVSLDVVSYCLFPSPLSSAV